MAMSEQKNYMLHTIKTLLCLEEVPYELSTSTSVDKFIENGEVQYMTILYNSAKEFKVMTLSEMKVMPKEGLIVLISKIKTDVNLKQFYNFTIKHLDHHRALNHMIQKVYQPILNKNNHQSLLQIKELNILLQNVEKKKFTENDLTFTKFQHQFEFWQDQDLDTNSPTSKAYLKLYAPIQKIWRNSLSIQLSQLSTLIETTWAILSNIWNLQMFDYPEKRYQRLVEVFELEVKNIIKMSFQRQSDIYSSEFQVTQTIIEAYQCCKRFIQFNQYYLQVSQKKIHIQIKHLQDFQNKIVATFRLKKQIQFFNQLFEDKLISENPSSLIFLIKVDNFMGSNYSTMMKSNPKVQQKLEMEKQKLTNITALCIPLLESELKESIPKPNINYLLKTLEKWSIFFPNPTLVEPLQEFQDMTVKRIAQYFDTYIKDQEKLGEDRKSETQKLQILKNIEIKLTKTSKIVQEFAENSTIYPTFVSKYEKHLQKVKKRQQQILKGILNEYERIMSSKANEVERSKMIGKNIEVLEFNSQESIIIFKNAPQCMKFINNIEQLLQMKYKPKISDKVYNNYEEAKKYLKENLVLNNIVLRYNSIENKLQFFQKKLLEKEIKEIKEFIQKEKGKRNTSEWKNVEDLRQFNSKLNSILSKMTEYLKLFNSSESEIQQFCNELLGIEFHKNNFYIIEKKIEQIFKIMQMVSIGRDSTQWKLFWRQKLTEIIGLSWQFAMVKGIQIQMSIKMIINGKRCEYEPELYEIKQKYYKELKYYVGWPLESTKQLNNGLLLQSCNEIIVELYEKVQSLFQKLLANLGQFKDLQRIWDIDLDTLEEKIIKKEIKQSEYSAYINEVLHSLEINKMFVESIADQEKIQDISISNKIIKQFYSQKISSYIESVLGLIKYNIKMQCEEIEDYISNINKKLEIKSKSIEEIMVVLKQFEGIKEQQKKIQNKIIKIEQKNQQIKNKYGVQYNIFNMKNRWENLQITLVEIENILAQQKQRLEAETLSKFETIEIEVQRSYKKYTIIRNNFDQEQFIDIYLKIKEWLEQWDSIERKIEQIEKNCQFFKIKRPQLPRYSKVSKQLQGELKSWKFFIEYRSKIQVLQKQLWVTYRGSVNTYNEIVMEYSLKIKDIVEDQVIAFFKKILEDNKQIFHILKCLTGQNFEKEHWGMLFSILKLKNIHSVEKLSLKDLLESDLMAKQNQIRELEARAKGQINIRTAIDELEAWSITKVFELTEYNSMGRVTSLIKQWKDVMTEVSDHQAMIISIKDNKYATRFRAEIEKYQLKFGILDTALLKLNQIQRKWIYLEPIFMRGALPQEQPRWRRLDQDYRNIMNNIANNSHVIGLTNVAGFTETLNTIMAQLERCQKALNDFLEEKRNKFPRFYFLGDDDMLEILGQSQNPTIIQLHLKKLFSGIHTVKFGENNEKILAMRSNLKQEVVLTKEIEVSQIVQNWLQQLSKNMVETLKASLQIIKSIQIQQSFTSFSCQIICLWNELSFNRKTCVAIKSGKKGLQQQLKNSKQFLTNLTIKCHEVKEELTLAKIKSLILDVIHHIAIIQLLIQKDVNKLDDWNWYKQLVFVEQKHGLRIHMAYSEFQYSFQYQGNAQKLVSTPLTDKCYLTLTQAMHMGLGGNPYGPAGTGKTESVKALALAFGRQVLVFNCDEGLDFHSMGRIFIGLVKCGAWGCFDQFNRLLEEQLSAISQQIQIIQEAIKAKENLIHLLGKNIQVNFNSAIFVTLNPAGKGYGGRSKLPDNLKQLFRPVAMSVPDNQLIAQVLLFSQGFKTAKILASKIITIFTLSKQLLSRQLHYDWGLRALKTILTVAGRLCFEQKDQINSSIESEILIKALRINTISKLTFNDMLKFNVLVEDVFPSINIKDIIYTTIQNAIQNYFQDEKFQILPNQLHKILQFYQATKQRIGAVLVGPSGCGKTTIWKALKNAYEKLGQVVRVHLINPKSMPRSSFLGHMNNDTRQFSEGVLTSSAREVVKSEQQTLNWIICDGDVDPEWIEALNSVLDDNHLLTLPTGERISFGSNVNFIFETDNLSFASPATISRMGMIFMNDEDINIHSIIAKWSNHLKEEQSFIKAHVDFIEKMCQAIWKMNSQQIVSTTKVGLVRNALSLIPNSLNQLSFKLNLVKGLATNFHLPARCQIFQMVFGKPSPNGRDPLSFRIHEAKISQYQDDSFTGLQRIYPIKSIKKDIEIVSSWLKANSNVIIVGSEGCGKSLLLEASIEEIQKQEKCKIVTIHCNRETRAALLIQKLYQNCQKATSTHGKILKPQNCNKQIFVLKEINLAKPDKYNTIEIVTFLQSLITHKGFYDPSLEFIRIADEIQFVVIIKPSSTIGRHEITTRFVSNLRVLKIDYESVGTREKLQLFTPHAQQIQLKLKDFWNCIQTHFKPDDNAHYLFCPRNLNSIVDNLEHYQIQSDNLQEVLSALRHEVNKQFQDRLVDLSEKIKFRKLIDTIFAIGQEKQVFYLHEKKLRAIGFEEYKLILEKNIKSYESEVKEIGLVLVDEVVHLMNSIERKIVQKGALLMAGSSGSLRKTALRIVAFKNQIPIYSLSNLRNPSLKEFYKDVKAALEVAGGQNKKIILFFEEHQLGKNQFYQKINSLISSGEISGLFASEQIEGIVQDAQTLKSEYFGKNLYESFVERIKNNVIIVLSMDHRNKSFYEICSSNPAFYSFCRIIWLNCYSKESLEQIFEEKVKHLNLKENKEIKAALSKIHVGSTLKYIKLLNNFISIYLKTQSKSGNKLEKLSLGLKKLGQTAKIVDSITAEAMTKEKLLTIKQKQAEESLNYITEAMEETSASKAEQDKLKVYLEAQEKKIEKDRKIVMAELQKVLPLIEEAKAAVGGLTPKNIQQIRSFMNPPDAVRVVLKAVLSLFGNKDDSWNSMKNFLKVCKDQILLFDIREVRESVRKEVEAIINEHAYSFQRENVFKASQDAVPLADWVKAAVQYSKTYQKVRPLEENLIKIEKELSRSKIRFKQCSEKVAESDAKIKQLTAIYAKKTNQAQTLKDQLSKAQIAQKSGQELLSKLQDEKVRWEIDADKLKVEVEMMPRYAAMTACFMTYLSLSPENIRHLAVEKWKKIFGCHFFNFLSFVTNEATTLQEVTKGLPYDQLSIENSQILLFLKEIPLIIDPHTQATNWLKQKLSGEGTVETLTQQDSKFLNSLELAVRFGKTLIIQEIDYIEPVLTAIIKQDYMRQGSRTIIQIGEKMIDVNQTFRLFLTTRNSSIEIANHQKDLLSLVNFSVTKSGLQGKLLSIIITYFQPEIQKQKQQLLEDQEKLKINLSDLEEKLLKELADSSGNILENKSLINSLNETKEQSQIVGKSLKESQNLQRTLDEKRQVYKGVAEIGAKLYISLQILKNLNPMYKYNLSQFINLFQQALNRGEQQQNNRQIDLIQEALIQIVYNNISVGLIKSHRLLLGVIFIREVYQNSITDDQFNLLVGNIVTTQNCKTPDWLDEPGKENYRIFQSVVKTQENVNSQKWNQWYLKHQCEEHFPNQNNLTPFQQTLMVNVCRPDRLINSLNNFVMKTLNLSNLSGIEINMKLLTEEKMKSSVPALFIVSIGFDPSKEIQEYANKRVGKQKFQELSMGGDQNQYALQLLRDSAKQGKWLCLKNLHLVIAFVTILEKQVLSMQSHQNFRLFLTTQAHEKFPPILLETCYKISYEAPPGLKQNFTRLLHAQPIEKSKHLQLTLVYFHALIQERRNYIPQGWNKFYEFNYGDYKSGLAVINEITRNKPLDKNWAMLYGLMLDTIYGGRIDNDVDRRLLDVYVQQFFNQEVETGKKTIFKNIKIRDFQMLIEKLPNIDTPELYSLPMGIDKAILRIKAKQIVENLKIATLTSTESSKFSREVWGKSLGLFFTLWKGLQKLVPEDKLKRISDEQLKSIDPIESFVYSEYNEAILNYFNIRAAIQKLEGVLFGNEILVTEIEELGKIMIKGETPVKWRKIWEGPDLLSEWIKLFVRKLNNLEKWKQITESGKLLNQDLNLSEVYRPQIFFNAFKQKVGREKKIPINQLKIKSSFSKPSGELFVKIKGLVLQGCSFAKDSICQAKNDQEYEEIPVFYIYFNEKEPTSSEYFLPFYTDMTRSTLLCMLPIANTGNVEKNVMASAAMLLNDI